MNDACIWWTRERRWCAPTITTVLTASQSNVIPYSSAAVATMVGFPHKGFRVVKQEWVAIQIHNSFLGFRYVVGSGFHLVGALPVVKVVKEGHRQRQKIGANKPKEPLVTTILLKMNLHCLGCIEKINWHISKTKGVHFKSIVCQEELVMVKGTVDEKALAHKLKEKMK